MFLQISADLSVNGSSTGLILPLIINIIGYQNVFYFLRILILFILKVRASCFSWIPGTIWAHFHISLSLLSVLLPHPWCRSKYHCQSLFSTRCWTNSFSKCMRCSLFELLSLATLTLHISWKFSHLGDYFFCKWFVVLFPVEPFLSVFHFLEIISPLIVLFFLFCLFLIVIDNLIFYKILFSHMPLNLGQNGKHRL